MREMLTADLGPSFIGLTVKVDGRIVCLATPRVEHDPAARQGMRDLIRRHGGDCAKCRNCLIGRAG